MLAMAVARAALLAAIVVAALTLPWGLALWAVLFFGGLALGLSLARRTTG
jgi:xanthine/uracil/vitamin C permease (AzgA family)